MKALQRKLFRDCKQTFGQILAIALVIAGGVTTFIMSLSTLDSLNATRSTYYQEYDFADVFASVKRAPQSLSRVIAAIEGVDKIQTRIVAPIKLVVPNFNDPIKGQVLSIPNNGQPTLNKLYLRQGRWIDPLKNDEVLINKPVADAHQLKLGDKIQAVIKGRLKSLTIVGVVLSPETIYQVAPGAIVPDFKRYGVLWMSRRQLEASFDMNGAFNDVLLSLSPGVSLDKTLNNVLERLDLILAPYGGLDSYGREWQISHRFLNEEFNQLQQMATIFSTIFLGVAAFLLNIVIKRLIDTQREQIAALKAFGYRNTEIAWHYISYVLLIVFMGLLLGTAAGVWLGKGLGDLYMDYYHFPFLDYQLQADRVIVAGLITIVAAIAGTLLSVKSAVSLAPAAAMQAEPPAHYQESIFERLGIKKLVLKRWLSQANRMILRHLERKPIKSLLSSLGIAMACAIMVVGTFFKDAIDYMVDIEFGLSQQQDATVTFIEPTSRRVLFDLLNLPGINYGEVFRSVPVRLKHQHRSYRTSIQGYEENSQLYRLLNKELAPIKLPERGLVLTDHLSDMLGITVGDTIFIEVLEGHRPTVEVPVVGLVSQYIGVGAYMNIRALNRVMKEGDAVSGAYLTIDPEQKQAVYNLLRDMPRIANTDVRLNVINNFKATVTDFMLTYVAFISVLAGTITFGVVYNMARIALSERSRELASMRVLGFTHREIAYVLLGELALLTLISIPIGLFLGFLLCKYLVNTFQHEIFRIPLIINQQTYFFAAFIVLIAATLSGSLLYSRIKQLDLIAVLKTKE